ncbi:phage tail tube protein [Halomonas elongata]|uniref:phage tail tube protein n=1 Tax=Halomonas elongata TaxID=2746 RepID=UPI00186B9BD1|nr:phage tail tube protein [Halomonas elongata]MBW5802047.1 hypothetical protein [Halomonas elongata]
MLTRKQTILVKIETTAGTDASPDGSDRIYVAEIDVAPYEGDRRTLRRLRPDLGAQAELNAAPYVTATITVGAAGSGEVGTPPAYSALMRACGHSETITPDTSVEYAPIQEDWESCTIYYLQDGQQQKITGAKGTHNPNFTAGQEPTFQFQMIGLYNKPEAASPVTISALTQADEVPVNAANTKLTVHGHQACADSLTMSGGNTVNHKNKIGCEKIAITDRETTGQINLEAPNIATKDFFAAVESHQGYTAGEVLLEQGKTAGNIIELAGPKVQLSNISYQDSDGEVHYQMDTRWLPGDAGEPEYTYTFK